MPLLIIWGHVNSRRAAAILSTFLTLTLFCRSNYYLLLSLSNFVCACVFLSLLSCTLLPVDLMNLIQRSCTPTPSTFMMDGVWDFKDWLTPHLATLEQHSWYHVYRFTRNSYGAAVLHYKVYSTDPWLPNKDGVLLDGDQLLMVSTPTVT